MHEKVNRHKLQFGLVTPQEDRSCEQLLSAAREAEKLGFDSVWVYDHLFMSPKKVYPECWVILSAIAVETQRIRMGPLVLNNLLRHPSLVAKMGATLDQISHGRFSLGIGAGWYKEECEAYGIRFPSFTERTARLREAVEIIMKLWKSRGRSISYSGKYYKIKEARCLPPPYSKPHPLIFIGGKSNDALRIVTRHTLGFNVDQDWGVSLAEMQRVMNTLNYLCQLEGTDPEKVYKSMCVRLIVGFEESDIKKQLIAWNKEIASRQSLIKRIVKKSLPVVRSLLGGKNLKLVPPTSQIIGSPEECISQLLEYYELGVTDFYIKVYDFMDFEFLKFVVDKIIKPMKAMKG
jgi:alkanesulfonate monooxygenase SsuD/methylene tetrahydromethanopterin reductase-like flavin-dependent oxidoreductase (luciferase family)